MKILWKIIKFLITTVLIVVVLLGLLIGGLTAYWAYKENQFNKYNGHGFQYMHGYSSTDFKGYHVYDGEKLVKLDHESDFVIEDMEEMPILDGAEACYPLYAAFAKAVYKDIDQIEAEVLTWGKGSGQELSDEQLHALYCNGRIVSFTNSSVGYKRLIEKEVDLFIGAKPSKNQLEDAKQSNETIVSVPIGKEAFVFFVEEDNPINDLSMEDVFRRDQKLEGIRRHKPEDHCLSKTGELRLTGHDALFYGRYGVERSRYDRKRQCDGWSDQSGQTVPQ